MKSLHVLIVVPILALACLPLSAGGETPADDAALIAGYIEKLGSSDAFERTRATLNLESVGGLLMPLVESAAKQPDLSDDVKARLEPILRRMRARLHLHDWNQAKEKEISVWSAKVNMDGYDHGSHNNPNWDAAAREAITLNGTRAGAKSRVEQLQIIQKTQAALDKAINAGCDDPTVLMIKGMLASDNDEPADKVFSWFERAYKSASDNKADPYTKVIIDGRLLRGYVGGIKGKMTQDLLQQCGFLEIDMMNKYQKAAAVPGINAAALIAMAENVWTSERAANVKSDWVFNGIDPQLEKVCPNEAGVFKLKGKFNIEYAWDARGGGWANTVTPQMWKDFADRLDVASASLTKAWKLDPSDPEPPTQMITVQMGQDNGDDVMETWFKRAMAINPDNLDACAKKLLYLEPKWHGSPEAMLKFGHECYDEGNWYGRIPFELTDVHYAISGYSVDANAYFEQAAVWKDHEKCYITYLKLYPDDDWDRTNYAVYACFACRWKKANDLFKELGDRAVPTGLVDRDPERLKKLQQMAAEKAAE